MMKLLLFILLSPLIVCATTYDSNLLQIGAKIFPKITVMEKGTSERIQTNVNIFIVSTSATKADAQRLSGMIESQYSGVLTSHPLSLTIISPRDVMEMKNAHALILLMDPNDPNLSSLLEYAQRNKILTFSFDPELLSKGVAVSLYIGRSVKPYINLSTLKQVPFVFEYGFLKLSQPY